MDIREVASLFDARADRYATDMWHRRYAERLVNETPLRVGDRVLDAGTGTGFAACAIARRVGPSGSVLGVDVSKKMLALASRAVEAEGVRNVELREGDATNANHLHGSAFDVVICSAGLLYMPVERALSAWHRVLKPDGVVAFSTMQAGAPAAGRIFRECAARCGIQVKDPSEPLGSETRCRAALNAAGFDRCRVAVRRVDFQRLDPVLAWESNFRAVSCSAPSIIADTDMGLLREQYLEALASAQRSDPTDALRADVLFAFGHRSRALRGAGG